jgi:hypothetical protein
MPHPSRPPYSPAHLLSIQYSVFEPPALSPPSLIFKIKTYSVFARLRGGPLGFSRSNELDEAPVLFPAFDARMDLPVAVGAYCRYGVWMIRAAVGESMEMVPFKIRPLPTVKGSRLAASFANPGGAFQGVLPNCLRSIRPHELHVTELPLPRLPKHSL